jgi:hypothetical protein
MKEPTDDRGLGSLARFRRASFEARRPVSKTRNTHQTSSCSTLVELVVIAPILIYER